MSVEPGRESAFWVWLMPVALVGFVVSIVCGGLLLFYYRPDETWFVFDLVSLREDWGPAETAHSVAGVAAMVLLALVAVAPSTPRAVRVGNVCAVVGLGALWFTGSHIGPEVALGEAAPPTPKMLLPAYLLHVAGLPLLSMGVALAGYFLGLRAQRV